MHTKIERRMKLTLAMAAAALLVLAGCARSADETAARGLARRIVPQYASNIKFVHKADTVEHYRFYSEGQKLIVEGTDACAMARGLNHYLREYCLVTVGPNLTDTYDLPSPMPVVPAPVEGTALKPKRFFLNYCTFGYTMPWWKWNQWERFIDWMALQGINMPLAISGTEAVLLELWREQGLADDEILAWFTGPAHLPWNRMCNIDGVDGPLPLKWVEEQKQLNQRIVSRERALGMTPVLPAFNGHVPEKLKEIHPEARISDVSRWCGFPEENRCHFLSPTDSLYSALQARFLAIQERMFGAGHVYGMDLFNEVEAPCWEPDSLAAIARGAYNSLVQADPDARWLQMGWMFHNDRRHWTPENVKAYLEAIPQGKTIILDYYTEHTPVWTLTDSFHGQPYIFCYLGNFGGNTRLAGPYHTMSQRIDDVYRSGGDNFEGLGCTLEGFGINMWFNEYILDRAWNNCPSEDRWIRNLADRHAGAVSEPVREAWKTLADSCYVHGSISECPLVCGRPCMESWWKWTVVHKCFYPEQKLWDSVALLLEEEKPSQALQYDIVAFECQALGNRFATLRDRFAEAFKSGNYPLAQNTAAEMEELLVDIDSLAACEPALRLDGWLADAEAWGSTPEEKEYYLHNARHLVTTWGYEHKLEDYASRMWSGLVRSYYARRWSIFLDYSLHCLAMGKPYSQERLDERIDRFEENWVNGEEPVYNTDAAEDPIALAKRLLHKYTAVRFDLLTYNVGALRKYEESGAQEIARVIRETGATYVSLNELDSCNRRSNMYQLEALAKELECDNYAFASAFPFAGGAYGNGVITKDRITAQYIIALPKGEGYEARSVAVVETEDCVFASVHLDHSKGEAKLEQVRTLNDWFAMHFFSAQKPVFLCGDMNSTPDSEPYRMLCESWEPLSGVGLTYPAVEPVKCIDYIFRLRTSAPVKVLSYEVVQTTPPPSDHLPVHVVVETL